MRDQIINRINEYKIVAIVRNVSIDKWIPLTNAMYAGGIRLIEMTFSSKPAVSDQDIADGIEKMISHFGNAISIGAGTVTKCSQVELVAKAGGEFIISPDTNTAVINRTRELGLVSIPGAFTPTEILTAYKAGADFVKIFPVTSLGPEYIKAVKAPCSDIPLIAVGGINDKNILNYLKAGVSGFGIGTNIVNSKMIEAEDYDGITELAKQYTRLV